MTREETFDGQLKYWGNFLSFRTLKTQDPQRALLQRDLLKQRQAMLASLAERCLLAWVQDPSPMLGPSAQTWFWFNHFNVHAAKGQVGVLQQVHGCRVGGAHLGCGIDHQYTVGQILQDQ